MPDQDNLFQPNKLDEDLRNRLEALKKYSSVEIEKCTEGIAEQEKLIDDYKQTKIKIANFPKMLRRQDWFPINDYAFIRGTFNNTNKFYTLLGGQYLAERSAAETVEFIDRRLKSAYKVKEAYENQKTLAKSKLEFADNLFEQEKTDVVEIREPFDADKLRPKKQKRKEVSHQEFETVMSRLEQLEVEEAKSNEMDFDETLSTKDMKANDGDNGAMDDKATTITAPKGISQEAFDRLIKQVDEMIESSSDEEDFEEEDISEVEEEEGLDSDDSLPEEKKITPEADIRVHHNTIPKPSSSKKRGVQFAMELETGPTEKLSEKDDNIPKSILRNKDSPILIDHEALKDMNELDKPRQILPATDAFKGVFIERNADMLIQNSSNPNTKTISKFKAQRSK